MQQPGHTNTAPREPNHRHPVIRRRANNQQPPYKNEPIPPPYHTVPFHSSPGQPITSPKSKRNETENKTKWNEIVNKWILPRNWPRATDVHADERGPVNCKRQITR